MLDGDVGAEAFAVIREAINKEGMVAIGKVVFTSRAHHRARSARKRNAGRHAAPNTGAIAQLEAKFDVALASKIFGNADARRRKKWRTRC